MATRTQSSRGTNFTTHAAAVRALHGQRVGHVRAHASRGIGEGASARTKEGVIDALRRLRGHKGSRSHWTSFCKARWVCQYKSLGRVANRVSHGSGDCRRRVNCPSTKRRARKSGSEAGTLWRRGRVAQTRIDRQWDVAALGDGAARADVCGGGRRNHGPKAVGRDGADSAAPASQCHAHANRKGGAQRA